MYRLSKMTDKFGLAYGFIAWMANYFVTFWFFYLIPGLKKYLSKASFKDLESDLRKFANLSLKSLGFKAELLNPHDIDLLEQDFILASNHRSWFDQISLSAVFPRGIHFLAKADYFKMPVLGRCLRTFEAIPVTNKSLDKSANQLLFRSIQKNENICFFVEGTRGEGKQLLPFKMGAFQVAAKFNKPILPVYILGAERCSSKQRHLFDIRPGIITIVVGRPKMFTRDNLEQQVQEFEAFYTKNWLNLYHQHELYQSDQHIFDKLEPTTLAQV